MLILCKRDTKRKRDRFLPRVSLLERMTQRQVDGQTDRLEHKLSERDTKRKRDRFLPRVSLLERVTPRQADGQTDRLKHKLSERAERIYRNDRKKTEEEVRPAGAPARTLVQIRDKDPGNGPIPSRVSDG